jgi:hypothetical protein
VSCFLVDAADASSAGRSGDRIERRRATFGSRDRRRSHRPVCGPPAWRERAAATTLIATARRGRQRAIPVLSRAVAAPIVAVVATVASSSITEAAARRFTAAMSLRQDSVDLYVAPVTGCSTS